MSQSPHNRIGLFTRMAPFYDLFVDLFSLRQYSSFLKKAVKVLAPQPGEKILELCSGTGRAASWVARAVGTEGEVVGIDVAPSMVDVARRRYVNLKSLKFRLGDITQPWELQGPFAGILMTMALHELPQGEREGVLKRSYLALKEGGRIVIADFNPEVSGWKRDLLVFIFRLIERENLNYLLFKQEEALSKAGFSDVKPFRDFLGLLQITLARRAISPNRRGG